MFFFCNLQIFWKDFYEKVEKILFLGILLPESTYKKCLREEWGKFTGYQLLS